METIGIKTYVEAFQCCFKDSTNGTQDYRSLSGWIFILLGFSLSFWLPSLQSLSLVRNLMICTYFFPSLFWWDSYHLYPASTIQGQNCNTLMIGLFLNLSLGFATAVDVYDTSRNNEMVRLMMVLLLTTPHCVLWAYMVWKAELYFFGCSCKDSNKERRRMLETEKYEL